MGYKQHNNPFSRKISSPLKHNVTNAAGETWRHAHNDRGKVISLEAKNISGSSKFGERANRAVRSKETGTKRLSEERGGGRATEKNYALDYARQISDMYNRGELVGGQFIADDFYKKDAKTTFKKGKLKIKPRFKSVGDAKRYNVQYADMQEGFDPEIGFQTTETQYTPEQIYDMMVQGGGMVSIVDGKIVAGNPNEIKYNITDEDYENYRVGGTDRYKTIYNKEGYVPEGFTSDERSDNKTGALTVKELLEQRRKKQNNPINRVMSNSPLNQTEDPGGENDERSDYNISGDPRVSTITEIVYDEKGRPIGEKDIITTEQDYIREREIINETQIPPNWQDCYENGVFQTGKIVGSGANAIKCEMDPDPQPTPEPTIETDEYTDTNVEEVFRPYEPEPTPDPEPIPDPEPVVVVDRFNTDSGSLKGQGLELQLPQMSMPDLQALFKQKTGKSCSGCQRARMIDVILGRRSR